MTVWVEQVSMRNREASSVTFDTKMRTYERGMD